MKQIILAIIIFSGIILISCNSNSSEPAVIVIDDVNIKEISIDIIDQKTVMGFLAGFSFEKSEVYVKGLFPEDNKHVIRVLDVYTGEEKNRLLLPKGAFQSPRDFALPAYIQFLDDKYFIIDGLFKIAAFDTDFNHLFSNMFQHQRYFVDFYSRGGKIYFLLGNQKYLPKECQCRYEIYEIVKNKRPVYVTKLHECSHEPKYSKNTKKKTHVGYLWNSSWGFEKDGYIFYSDNKENKYYRYNLDSGEKHIFELPFLNAKKYSDKDAEKMARYKDTGWWKKVKRKVVYIAPQEPIYNFGLYDVGKGKIGVASGIDMDNMTFRLDVLDHENGKYIESIRLPFGVTFKARNSSGIAAYYYSFFDLDHGIYIWGELEGEGLDEAVKITKFKIKNEKE